MKGGGGKMGGREGWSRKKEKGRKNRVKRKTGGGKKRKETDGNIIVKAVHSAQGVFPAPYLALLYPQ